MAELLVELFSEEIPARMQARAAEDFKGLVTAKLKAAGLEFASAAAHVTPRRLALVVDGLPASQPDVREERRGPRADAPEKALQGFLGSVGLTLEQCEKRDTGKGEFWFAVIEKQGGETRDVLPGIILESIRELPWPKSMRWGRNTFRWVRPLHHVLAVFDGAVLDGGLDLGDQQLAFTGETRGHRFLAPEPFAVEDFADYRGQLKGAFVVLDREERKAIIAEGIAALAAGAGLTFRGDPGLLDEVCGLVEWPVPMLGRIDDQFMGVPKEVLVTSMRSHQKYFALETADGALADRFAVVANMASESKRDATIVAGNEKVLRARLSDAKFFWDQDRKQSLESRIPALADVKFYEALGSMADKVGRVAALARLLSPMVPGADPEKAERAARLAKADLTSGMVGEFPELQGVMGRYYARHDGEDAAVAEAVAEHYSPLGPGDRCPTSPVSVTVALADKIDTLLGFFAIGETPTGSKDPFALRRAALGVIRLVLENDLRLKLQDVFAQACTAQPVQADPAAVSAALLGFFADRLKVHLREQGVRHDLVAAIFELGGEDDLVRLLARVHALAAFLGTEDGANLLAGFRRAVNILRAEEKKDGVSHAAEPEVHRLVLHEEASLHAALAAAEPEIESALKSENFAHAMATLATLRAPIDAFFDKVTVNADDPDLRVNRLRLLARVRTAMGRVAEFSRVEG